MADYKLAGTNTFVIRTADGAGIPNDPGNRDWVVYQQWLSTGGVPDPYVAPPEPTTQDANARLDAGITAALTVAVEVRNAIHAIPNGFTPAHFAQLLVQLNVMTDAFVAMLQAQADV